MWQATLYCYEYASSGKPGAILHRVTLSLVLLTALSLQLYPQTNAGECLNHVRSLYRKLGDPPPEGKVYAMSYTIQARVRRAGDVKNISSNVRLLMSRHRMHLLTDEMEVYQDERAVFTVLPRSRMLYVHDSNADSGQDLRKKIIGAFQDSLFSACTVLKCAGTKGDDGREKRRVVLQIHEKMKKLYGIATVAIDVDAGRQSIDQVEYTFVPGSPQEWMKVTVDDLDYDSRTSAFNTPLTSMFFDGRGAVVSKYRGYTLTDDRARKKR